MTSLITLGFVALTAVLFVLALLTLTSAVDLTLDWWRRGR